MALVTCPDCRRQISDVAPACIHCGRPMRIAQAPATGPGLPDADPGTGSVPAAPRPLGARILLGTTGGIIGLLSAVSAGSSQEGPIVLGLVAVGTVAGCAPSWFLTRGQGRRLRWYHVVPGSVVGSVAALVIAALVLGSGDAEALGFAVGAGLSYGILFGSALSLLMYALVEDVPAWHDAS